MKKIILLLAIVFTSCNFETPTQFSKKALNDTVYSLDNKAHKFKDVLNQYKSEKVLIDVWASWCRDCIKGMPAVKELQKQFPDVVFLFLSVDKKQSSWKKGVQRYKVEGEHYNLPKGMKDGDLVDFLNIRWIPRYIVVDEQGSISFFKATEATDKRIIEALK